MTTLTGAKPHPIFLAGRWVESPDPLVIHNPARPDEPAGSTYHASDEQYEEAGRIYGEVIPLDLMASSRGRVGITRRFPIGPVAGISPFNFPLNLAAHKLAPAIASGNPIVLKPPSKDPLVMLTVAEIVAESGA